MTDAVERVGSCIINDVAQAQHRRQSASCNTQLLHEGAPSAASNCFAKPWKRSLGPFRKLLLFRASEAR